MRRPSGSTSALATAGVLLLGSHAGCLPGDVDGLSSGTGYGGSASASSGGADIDGATAGSSASGSSGLPGAGAGGAGGTHVSGNGGTNTPGTGGGNVPSSGGTSAGGAGAPTAGGSGGTTIGSGGISAGGSGGISAGGSGGISAGGSGGVSAGGAAGSSGGNGGTACEVLSSCPATQVCNSGTCVAPQGVVVLSVPLTKSGQNQRYADTFNPVLNLTSTAVTLRLYAPGATGGSLLIYLSDTNSTSGTGATVPLTDINKAWKDVKFDAGAAGGSFNPAQVKQVTIEVTSTNSGPWTNPTIIYIDSIRNSASVFDDPFDSSLEGMVKSSMVVVAGSTLAWSSSIP